MADDREPASPHRIGGKRTEFFHSWSHPRQAVVDFIVSRGYDAATLRILKERTFGVRLGLAVAFRGPVQGRDREFRAFAHFEQNNAGLWRMVDIGATSPLKHSGTFDNSGDHVTLQGSPTPLLFIGGTLAENTVVRRVELIDANGRRFADTVENTSVLFLGGTRVRTPLRVMLRDASDRVIGEQDAFSDWYTPPDDDDQPLNLIRWRPR